MDEDLSFNQEENVLELLMFARKSKKNLPVEKEMDWFDYGAFFHDYVRGCDGLKVHSSTRFFDPKTGQVWLPKEGLLIRICEGGVDDEVEEGDGSVRVTEKSRCNFLENPLCSHLTFRLKKERLKKSKQSPREFLEVLRARGIDDERMTPLEEAKKVYDKYFS